MPIVFTQKLENSQYLDKVGTEYQFPERYVPLLNLKPGEKFVYYRPKEGHEGQYFFGSGAIESLTPHEKTCIAKIKDYKKFKTIVPYKNKEGFYNETLDESKPFFQWSLRRIGDESYKNIIDLGG